MLSRNTPLSSNVVYWDGSKAHIVASGIGFPNGISLTADRVLVAATFEGCLISYAIGENMALLVGRSWHIDGSPCLERAANPQEDTRAYVGLLVDNMSVDERVRGWLWRSAVSLTRAPG